MQRMLRAILFIVSLLPSATVWPDNIPPNRAIPAAEAARRAEAIRLRRELAAASTYDAAFWRRIRRLEALGPPDARIAVERLPGATLVTPYKRVRDWAVAEDDRILGPWDAVQARQAILREGRSPAYATVPSDRAQWWPDAPIPFELDDALEDDAKAAIRAAINAYEALTPVRFRARRDSDEAWIRYEKQMECCGPFGHLSSMTDHVGWRDGENKVKLQTVTAAGDPLPIGDLQPAALHETGHILGLYHEFTRPDRDRFIRVDMDCVDFWYGISGNFAIEADSLTIGPYDFQSIMHYPSRSGEKGPPWDRKPCTTMVRRDNGAPIQATTTLSVHDINALHHIYGRPSVDGRPGDAFGARLLTFDFDRDGFMDLAVGVPGRADRRGSVHLYKGTASGIVLWKILQPEDGAPGDGFGWALAAGDFDGDGITELAVGAPLASVNGKAQGGKVYLFHITGNRDATAFDVLKKPASSGPVEVMDRFGNALESGRFLVGALAPRQLAIGAPGARGANGLRTGRTWLRVPNLADPMTEVTVTGAPATRFGQFGFALTKLRRGGGPGVPETHVLVIAAPGVTLGGCGDPAIYTTSTRFQGLQTNAAIRPDQWQEPAFCPQDPNLSDAVDAYPNPIWDAAFGTTMASGDFDGDGNADLAVAGGGKVAVFITDAGGRLISRGSLTGADPSFGAALAAADLDGDGREDLLVGSPLATANGRSNAGMVQAFRGCNGGRRCRHRLHSWYTIAAPATGSLRSAAGDRFGMALAATGGADLPRLLAVGAPDKGVLGEVAAGAAFLFVPGIRVPSPYRDPALNQAFTTKLRRP